MIRLGVNSVLFVGFQLETAMQRIAWAGFDGIEISAIKGMCEHLRLDDWRAQAGQIREMAEQYGLGLHAMEEAALDETRLMLAFEAAAVMAFEKAARECNPVLLEPIMRIQVTAPSEYIGNVISDLNTRRAQIHTVTQRGPVEVVEGLVPLAEMFKYATDLRSMTQGRGAYSMEFSHYAEVPPHILKQILP